MSNSRPAWQTAPLGALCISASLLCLSGASAARADAPARSGLNPAIVMPLPPTQANGVRPRVGRARSKAHDFPPSGWVNVGLATASDGYSVSVWDHAQDGTMAEWVYDPSGNAVVQGPTYGPYTDGNGNSWAPYAIGVNPNNDRARILWNRSDGAAGVWTMDENGNAITVGPTYGPFSDSNGSWTAIGIATAHDGSSNVLWERSDGAMGEWVFDANDEEIGVGPVYGPYADGTNVWGPIAIGTNPTDYTARVLWERSDGLVGVWSMDEDANESDIGPTYGPFSDSNGNWNPVGLATANDGTSALLWLRDDGAGGVWGLDAGNSVLYVGPTYGPTATPEATGLPPCTATAWASTQTTTRRASFGIAATTRRASGRSTRPATRRPSARSTDRTTDPSGARNRRTRFSLLGPSEEAVFLRHPASAFRSLREHSARLSR